jgi:hypothetical protein
MKFNSQDAVIASIIPNTAQKSKSKNFISLTVFSLVLLCSMQITWGQSIFSNPITGTNPNTSNPYTTGQTLSSDITVSGIGRGSGITGANASDRYNANGWNSGSLNVNDYFEWTITPNSCREIDFISFVYISQRSNNSIANFAFRSSRDNFVANIGTPDDDGTTISLSANTFQNITSPITFRLYAWGADQSSRTFSINDFTFNGSVTIANSTVTAASSIPKVCVNTALTNITHTTSGATGIGTATGLPAGVTATWSSNTITISGTPATSGTFNYTIPLTGGCGSANATGTITVLSAPIQFPILENGDYIWTGGTDENWSTAANWSVFNSASNTFSTATTNPNSAVINVVIPPMNSCNSAGISTIRNNRLDADRDVKNITILSNGKVTVDGTDDLDVFGNWINNGTFDHNNQDAKVDFKHQTNLQTIGGTNETAFYKLEISENNSNNVILNQNISVLNDFKFDNNRKLEIGNNSILFISGASISGANQSRYIVTNGFGVVKRNVSSGNVTFPVGVSLYNPCRLSNSGISDVFSVRVVDNVTDNGTGVGATTSAKCVKRTWMISEDVVGGSNVTMRLQWNGNNTEHINGFVYNPGFMYIAHHDGTNWEDKGSNGQSNAADAYFVSQTNITSFSPFAIADNSTPLPIELVSFQANCAGDEKINVTWTTASEHNTSHYVVEHSRNGNDWDALTIVAAAGNSTSLLDYTYVHEQANAGTNYYRLTQYDNDGAFEQFNAVAAACDNMNNTTTLSTYPNPSENSFYINLYTEDLDGAGKLTITDARGNVVHTQEVSIEKGNSVIYMNNMNIAPGMYYMQVTNGNTSTDIIKHSLR